MANLYKRIQAIKRKLIEKHVPECRIIDVDLTVGETEEKALKKFRRKNEWQEDDVNIFINLVDEKIIRQRKTDQAALTLKEGYTNAV